MPWEITGDTFHFPPYGVWYNILMLEHTIPKVVKNAKVLQFSKQAETHIQYMQKDENYLLCNWFFCTPDTEIWGFRLG